MSDNTLDRLVDLLVAKMNKNVPDEMRSPQTPLFENGLGLDSFAVVEFITLIEEEFQIEFAESDLKPEVFVDLGRVAEIVRAKKALAASA